MCTPVAVSPMCDVWCVRSCSCCRVGALRIMSGRSTSRTNAVKYTRSDPVCRSCTTFLDGGIGCTSVCEMTGSYILQLITAAIFTWTVLHSHRTTRSMLASTAWLIELLIDEASSHHGFFSFFFLRSWNCDLTKFRPNEIWAGSCKLNRIGSTISPGIILCCQPRYAWHQPLWLP